MKNTFLIFLMLCATTVVAQKPMDSMWHFLPFTQSGYAGIDYERAEQLSKNMEANEIVVAVIDNGVDINHPDLQGSIWVNEDEIAGNGIDDDNNGYIDDIHGWNFIGSADTNVTHDNLELTRQYVILREKYRNSSASAFENDPEYQRYLRVDEDFKNAYNTSKRMLDFYNELDAGFDRVEKKFGTKFDPEELLEYQPKKDDQLAVALVRIFSAGKDTVNVDDAREAFAESRKHYEYLMDYGYNTDFDPREELVGDNYEDAYEKYYGNNQVYINEEFSSHGTHVAGIIAANRDNDIGAKGICANAKIMVLRCVPDGDERDKDVANSIIYAVDNGAKIINMSFGKGYAHSSEAVKAAIKYAQENNVLLIHAAGNDSENNDETDNFPNDFDGSYQDVWIEVGASSWYEKPDMLASFSNYGRAEVDVFAPGVAIYSTMPDSAYEALDGTSMASPVVAGVAAYVWSYYPDLSAEELRDILVESTEYLKRRQKIPGSKKKRKLKKLSASGGIINLANAMELAALRSSGQ